MNIREKILVIEDEKSIAQFIAAVLDGQGYETIQARTGAEGLSMISSHCPDLVILDLGLPDMDGMDILRQLRSWSSLPVVVVSARSHERDKVTALDQGADDYLTKPFGTDELLARVRAMLRRAGDYKPPILRFGDLELDCGSSTLRCRERAERLSGREFQVMELFMRSPQVILSAERIMERVWGWDTEAEINVVWVHISNLRKKLSAAGSTVSIRASRGLGYSLEDAG